MFVTVDNPPGDLLLEVIDSMLGVIASVAEQGTCRCF